MKYRSPYKSRRDEATNGPLRIVLSTESAWRFCTHPIPLTPEQVSEFDAIYQWARSAGLRGSIRRALRYSGWSIDCANPDTAFAIKMRWG